MATRSTFMLGLATCFLCQMLCSEVVFAQIEYQATELLSPRSGSEQGELSLGSGIATGEAAPASASSNQMLWQQYQALQTGGGSSASDCEACSGGAASDYDRCGCNLSLFPWIGGPGNCDQWCVGPKWEIDGGGLFMFRDDVDWAAVTADPNGGNGATPVLEDQFEHGMGGRVSLTGYNDSGFGVQVAYEGINDWNATLAFEPGGGDLRDFTYQSRLNSVEINFLPNNPSPWKWFSGVRYVQFDEDFLDLTTVAKAIPAPAAPATIDQFNDNSINRLIENRLFGFQLGGRRDAWNFGTRFMIRTFANAGVYCNKLRRDDVDLTITTTIAGDDTATADAIEFSQTTSTSQTTIRRDLSDIAFVGEAGVGATWRLNHCTAVQAGYQILALDGVSQGIDAFLAPNAGLNNSTLVFHGLQFGFEYRR